MTSGWQRISAGTDRDAALRAVDDGTDWVFLWCIGKTTRPEHRDAAQALAYARAELISPDERDRLAARGERKGKVPTVVMAEKWRNDHGDPLIVFYERAPEALPERPSPDRVTDADWYRAAP